MTVRPMAARLSSYLAALHHPSSARSYGSRAASVSSSGSGSRSFKRSRVASDASTVVSNRSSGFGTRPARIDGGNYVGRPRIQSEDKERSSERPQRDDTQRMIRTRHAGDDQRSNRPDTMVNKPSIRGYDLQKGPSELPATDIGVKRLPNALHYNKSEVDAAYESSRVKHHTGSTQERASNRWSPTKKLSIPTMAGIRALHQRDPTTYTPQHLSLQFGVSFEAIKRILKSKFRDKRGEGNSENSIVGTKWDPSPTTNPKTSPVPAIHAAFDRAVKLNK